MRSRPCVRCMPWPHGFPLVPALPSIGSAGMDIPLFADITGTMAGSDCFNPFVIDSDSLLSSAAPARLPGQTEALPSPGAGCTCVPGFPGQRGARQTLAMAVLQVLPSADDKTSALRIMSFTMLNHPGHTRRYRRFACILADAHARLAVKVVADPSFLPDLHRLPRHRFLGTRHPDCRSIWRLFPVENCASKETSLVWSIPRVQGTLPRGSSRTRPRRVIPACAGLEGSGKAQVAGRLSL